MEVVTEELHLAWLGYMGARFFFEAVSVCYTWFILSTG